MELREFCYTRLSQANSMNRLVIGNLLHRPLRSSISILAVAIEVAMILSIVGIIVWPDPGVPPQTNGIGADLIVRPPNQTFLVGVSGAPAPAKIADVLRKLPHVAVASPVIQQLIRRSRGGDHLGHRLRQFQCPAAVCLPLRGAIPGPERCDRG